MSLKKQCNGTMKGWLHCLMSQSKGRFLVNSIIMLGSAWCLVMAQIQFLLTKKMKIGRPEHSLTSNLPTSDNISLFQKFRKKLGVIHIWRPVSFVLSVLFYQVLSSVLDVQSFFFIKENWIRAVTRLHELNISILHSSEGSFNLPLLKALTPWPGLPPFLNLCFPSLFSVPTPLLRYFRQFPSPSPNPHLP